jgi:outer membrane immunogenic protein
MIRRIVLASVSVIALTAAASAADMYVPGPGGYKDAPIVSWAGFYAGVQAGWAGTDASSAFNNGTPTLNLSQDGFVGGGHIGYNFQRGYWVFGVEADIDGTNLNKKTQSLNNGTSGASLDVNWESSVRGRLGYAAGSTLFYGTGGVAFADINLKGGPAPAAGIGPLDSHSTTLTGWTAGGGVEHFVSPAFSVRVEYRHSDFDHNSFILPTYGVTQKLELTQDEVRVGASYHFGSGYVPLK